MLGMDDEKHLQCPGQLGVGFELFLVETIQHIEEVFGVSVALVGLVELPAHPVPESIGSQCGDHAKQLIDLFVSKGKVGVNVGP